MKKNHIFIVLALTLILLLVSGQEGCEFEPEQECSLSLCDCKCHLKGQTPEELRGVLCGINCYDLHNISGCKYVNGTCEIVYRNASQQENSSGISNQNPSNPGNSNSGCGCGH